MKALIQKLEAATGPSRELDGEIFKAVEEKPGDVWSNAFADDVWCRQVPDDTIAWDTPPYFTSSIDAAITLVPDKCDWFVQQYRVLGKSEASIMFDKLDDGYGERTGWTRETRGFHAYAAIALCIAALKAVSK